MSNLSEIMRRAHAIFKDRRDCCTFGEALKMSWGIARGFSAGFETSYAKDGKIVRVMGFAHSTTEARSNRIEAERWIVAEGFRPTGSSEFNLRRFVLAAQQITEITAPRRLAQAA